MPENAPRSVQAPAQAVDDRLRSLADPQAAARLERVGVGGEHTLGISIPVLRELAGEKARK
jgi:hypothetical protein